jgi:hypothetical protein
MSNTYNWDLQGLPLVSPSLDGLTNVVREVHWCVTATSDQMVTATNIDGKKYQSHITASRFGGPVQLGAPNPGTFTPFPPPLADIVGWYQAAMGEEQVADIIKSLDAEIEAKVKAAADPSTPVPMALSN